MNKKQWLIPVSACLMFGLSGCSSNDVKTTSKDIVRPIGYYSNEAHPNGGNGLIVDNDGPFTEWLDHNVGSEGRMAADAKRKMLQTRDENGNPRNPTMPLAKSDRNWFQRDNKFSTSDFNYHGHMNRMNGSAGLVTESNFQDDRTNNIRRTVAGVPNVDHIRTVGYGNTIMIAVHLVDNSKAASTKKAIKQAVTRYADGRPIQVLIDDGSFGRDRNFRNDIQRKPSGYHSGW